ncbi:MAG TPA: hypothetical protein VFK02_07625 [Kofleriaceae bacterium]|nr:hypothetical protein [Kofleriaceae bacterium]
MRPLQVFGAGPDRTSVPERAQEIKRESSSLRDACAPPTSRILWLVETLMINRIPNMGHDGDIANRDLSCIRMISAMLRVSARDRAAAPRGRARRAT